MVEPSGVVGAGLGDPTARAVRAARRLVSAGGLAAATIDAVSREAGVSNGSLYHWFGDRVGLLEAAQLDFYAEIDGLAREAMASGLPDDRDESVRFVVSAWVGFLTVENRAFPAFSAGPGVAGTVLATNATAFQKAQLSAVSVWIHDGFGCSCATTDRIVLLLVSLAGLLAHPSGGSRRPLVIDTYVEAILGVLDRAD